VIELPPGPDRDGSAPGSPGMAHSPARASFLSAWSAGDPDAPLGPVGPLILNTGTLRGRTGEAADRSWETLTSKRREALRSLFVETSLRSTERGGRPLEAHHFACVDTAWPRRSRCEHCGARSITFEGRCGRADCPLCFRRYPARRARKWRFKLGPAEHFWYVVLTVPPGLRDEHRADNYTSKAKKLAHALERMAEPLIPAGVLVLHVAGDEEPFVAKPHYNLILSSRAFDPRVHPPYRSRERIVRSATPVVDQSTMRALHVKAAELGFGWSADMVQANQSFNREHGAVAHNLRYVLRDQSFGDLAALLHWHKPRQQLVRGIGMCATGRQGLWTKVNPWPSQDSLARALGQETVEWQGSGPCDACGPQKDL